MRWSAFHSSGSVRNAIGAPHPMHLPPDFHQINSRVATAVTPRVPRSACGSISHLRRPFWNRLPAGRCRSTIDLCAPQSGQRTPKPPRRRSVLKISTPRCRNFRARIWFAQSGQLQETTTSPWARTHAFEQNLPRPLRAREGYWRKDFPQCWHGTMFLALACPSAATMKSPAIPLSRHIGYLTAIVKRQHGVVAERPSSAHPRLQHPRPVVDPSGSARPGRRRRRCDRRPAY